MVRLIVWSMVIFIVGGLIRAYSTTIYPFIEPPWPGTGRVRRLFYEISCFIAFWGSGSIGMDESRNFWRKLWRPIEGGLILTLLEVISGVMIIIGVIGFAIAIIQLKLR